MRCDGCDGKFGSNGEAEVEVDSYDVSDTSLSADVTLKVQCGNCGSDFKTGTLSFEQEIDLDSHDDDCAITDEHGIEVTLESDPDRFRELADSDRTFSITSVDASLDEDYRPKTVTRTLKDGTVQTKPAPRKVQRHYYDITLTFSVRCESCQGDFEVTATDSLSGSELEAA